jgi:hypothetical protein
VQIWSSPVWELGGPNSAKICSSELLDMKQVLKRTFERGEVISISAVLLLLLLLLFLLLLLLMCLEIVKQIVREHQKDVYFNADHVFSKLFPGK